MLLLVHLESYTFNTMNIRTFSLKARYMKLEAAIFDWPHWLFTDKFKTKERPPMTNLFPYNNTCRFLTINRNWWNLFYHVRNTDNYCILVMVTPTWPTLPSLTELPTLMISSCDWRFSMFSHDLTTNSQNFTIFQKNCRYYFCGKYLVLKWKINGKGNNGKFIFSLWSNYTISTDFFNSCYPSKPENF